MYSFKLVFILNFMCNGDHLARITYLSDAGSSVNDYRLLSNDLYAVVCDSCELAISERL